MQLVSTSLHGAPAVTLFLIRNSILQLLPICIIWILPDTRAEQREWRDSGRREFWGGAILLGVVVFSLMFSIVFNFTIVFT